MLIDINCIYQSIEIDTHNIFQNQSIFIDFIDFIDRRKTFNFGGVNTAFYYMAD